MSPPVTFLAPDLARWDQAPAGELMAVPLFGDQRPLRGTAALVDWRLCGKLSSSIVAGRMAGVAQEQMLFPSGGRLPWRLVLVFGVGARAAFTEETFRAGMQQVLKTMQGLGVRSVAVSLPGRDTDRVSARRALEMALEETDRAVAGVIEELTVIESAAGQKEMAEVLRQRAVRR